MKVLFFVCFLFFNKSCFAKTDEFDKYLFKNHFIEDINNDGRYLYSSFRIGDSNNIVFKNLDTNLYKNQKLGFILSDLSNQYNFLEGMAFNGVLGLDKNDFTHRTHFVFTFKFNDTLSLSIVGMIAKSEWFFEESDSTAFNRILDNDKYILLPVLYNKKEQYRNILELMKENKSPRLKNTLDELLRKFPEVAK